MKKNKIGFTLSEVLISVAVIGMILAFASHTINVVKTSYTATTYHAFNNVTGIVGELISGKRVAIDERDPNKKAKLPSPVSSCRKTPNGMYTTILAPDYRSFTNPLCFYAGDPTQNGNPTGKAENLFCRHTVYMANTAGETRCEEDDLFDVGYNAGTREPLIIDLSKPENWERPNFIATNGHRYYISKWASNKNISETYGFRIMAIDLNGKSGPNITRYTGYKFAPPDIVQFLILDNGEIYPLGNAGSNLNISDNDSRKVIKYLNTRIKGYNYRFDPNRENNVPAECKGKDKDTCNYAVVYLQLDSNTSFFSYKEALCGALAETSQISYKNYCYDSRKKTMISQSALCPPSNHEYRVDYCTVKLIKPAFRYNFK